LYIPENGTVSITGATTLRLNGTTMYIGSAKDTTIYLGSSSADSSSSTYALGNLYFKSNIWTYNTTDKKYVSGYTKKTTISSWTMGDVTFTFINGICTDVSGGTASESGDISGGSDIPKFESADAGKVLSVKSGGTSLEWTFLKKKFDVKMTGTASVDMSGYYTIANGATRYSSNGTLRIYEKDGAIDWTTGDVPEGATIKDTYYLRKSSGTYCYTASEASNQSVSVTLTGTSDEITLDGGNATNGNISITITGATAS
jgi:hypothetical protein